MAKCPGCGREVLRLVNERCGYCARKEYQQAREAWAEKLGQQERDEQERQQAEDLIDRVWNELRPQQVENGLAWLRGLAKETTQGSYHPDPSPGRTPNMSNMPPIPPDPAPYIPVTFTNPRIIERLKFQRWRIQQGLLDDDLAPSPCAATDE